MMESGIPCQTTIASKFGLSLMIDVGYTLTSWFNEPLPAHGTPRLCVRRIFTFPRYICTFLASDS